MEAENMCMEEKFSFFFPQLTSLEDGKFQSFKTEYNWIIVERLA